MGKPEVLTEFHVGKLLETQTMTKSSVEHLETEFTLLCEMRKRLCNGRWDVPQAKNKIWHSMHWLPKTQKLLKPNLRAFSELSKFGV